MSTPDFSRYMTQGIRPCFSWCEDNISNNHSAVASLLAPLSTGTAPILPVWHIPKWGLHNHGSLYGRFQMIWDVTNVGGAVLRVVPASAIPSTPTALAAATGLTPAQMDFDVAATVDGYGILEVWVDVVGSDAGIEEQLWTCEFTVITPGTATPTFRSVRCAKTTITVMDDHDLGVLLTVPTGTVNADSRVRSAWGCHFAQRNGT